MGCLPGSHLIVPDAVGNAILLVLLTLVNVVLPTMASLGMAGPRIEGGRAGRYRRYLVSPGLGNGRTHKHQTSKGNGRQKLVIRSLISISTSLWGFSCTMYGTRFSPISCGWIAPTISPGPVQHGLLGLAANNSFYCPSASFNPRLVDHFGRTRILCIMPRSS